jgi:two-component system LytT family sensor kinase
MSLASAYKNLPISVGKMLVMALLISLFFILKTFTNHLINDYNYEFSWSLVSAKFVINYFFWVVLAPLVYILVRFIQNKNKNLGFRIIQVLIGCVVLAILHTIASSRLDDLVNYMNSGYLKNFFGKNSITVLVIGSFSSLIELLVLVAIFLAFDYQKRYFVNQKALIAAQLNALRMQLQPHFLFNTLHSIASMVDIDTKNAQRMLSKLGTLLRKVLEYDTEQLVTVADELSFIKDYLDLEQIRYRDRLKIEYFIADQILLMKVPTMIFQPLVENAIKYGAVTMTEFSKIEIQIDQQFDESLREELLTIKISNTYDSKKVAQVRSTGLGLKNIKERLQNFYQDRFVFQSRFESDSLYVAKIGIPLNR